MGPGLGLTMAAVRWTSDKVPSMDTERSALRLRFDVYGRRRHIRAGKICRYTV